MFTTSLTAAVVSSMMASGALESPQWRTSYREAATAAADARKPIAVFITAGSPGKLVKGGGMGKEVAKLLHDGYIPLTVDTATADGKELAKTFDLTEGLVISDRTGGVQALRHTGSISDAELKGYLERFAAAGKPTTTEYRQAVMTTAAPTLGATFQPQYPQPAYQPLYQPQYAQPRPVMNTLQTVNGFMQNYGGAAIRGTCPNCR